MDSHTTNPVWLDRPIFKNTASIFTFEKALVFVILLLAVLSRFVMLGERVMSHDEVNHVVPSYELYQGRSYRHDPVTHGPFQFHAVALSYFLFGDSDFTSRVPAALFSIGAVAFVLFAFRRYLGRSGAMIAGLLFLISPFMMFYGRYTRNEAFIELIGVVTLYGILRYLEKGDRLAMFLVTVSTAMHFIVKETALIYSAQALFFLFLMFLIDARQAGVRRPERYNQFLLSMALSMSLVLVALGLGIIKADQATPSAGTVETATVTEELAPPVSTLFDPEHLRVYAEIALVASALVFAAFGLISLARDIGWKQLKNLRSLTLIVLIGTLVLPMLSPFPVVMLGWNPLDYSNPTSMLRTGIFVAAFFTLAAAIGILWNPVLWLQNAFVFYAIFTVFYTTFFTNGNGFLTGIVGSLGYWLSQQGVERGSQPRYYYALIQMPIYEFLAILGTTLAAYFGIKYRRFSQAPGAAPAAGAGERPVDAAVIETQASQADDQVPVTGLGQATPDDGLAPDVVLEEIVEDQEYARYYTIPQPLPVLGLLLFWGLSSLVAYSLAGERMPWLTVHIALPFLLCAGWGLGFLVDTTDWKQLKQGTSLLAVLLLPVLFASLAGVMGTLQGAITPFQGNTLEQLQVTSQFLVALIASGASLAGIIYLLRGWEGSQILRLAAVTFFALMALLTARAAYRASFINYDYATEYLVYAHAAPGPKEVLRQVEEISRRTTGDKSLMVAYSSDALYPYWWYLRDYPNHRWFQNNPTRDLRDFPVIIAGEDVYSKIEPIVSDNYIRYDYVRLWWPNQDYYNLTWNRVWSALRDPQMRAAVIDIWLNRDYRAYATLTSQVGPLSPETWSPAATMRMYVRKDIVGQIWDYGASPVTISAEETDPAAAKTIELAPVQVIGSTGSGLGQFQAPRGFRVADDGTLYVADSRNHRIQHLAPDGTVLQAWGTFADQAAGDAPGGTFYEPWDVALGRDGSVYVSDTWNHRIQKFTADGQFITMWGYFGQGEAPDAFWGPRGLAVDIEGRLYVMDTGNKRIVIFDPDGNFISQYGTAGFDLGQFDEPVGIAIDSNYNVFITDTWNQRIQVLSASSTGQFLIPLRSWDFIGWEGQSLENKPLIAVSPINGHVFVTDPEKPRVVEYDQEGNVIRAWGDYSTESDGFGLASGVTVTKDGEVWVSDGGNNVLLRFKLPE